MYAKGFLVPVRSLGRLTQSRITHPEAGQAAEVAWIQFQHFLAIVNRLLKLLKHVIDSGPLIPSLCEGGGFLHQLGEELQSLRDSVAFHVPATCSHHLRCVLIVCLVPDVPQGLVCCLPQLSRIYSHNFTQDAKESILGFWGWQWWSSQVFENADGILPGFECVSPQQNRVASNLESSLPTPRKCCHRIALFVLLEECVDPAHHFLIARSFCQLLGCCQGFEFLEDVSF
mmetsp:Transcript_28001/g.39365  ORF Transcript_28001/g.39365 Transcript_28001/m.39365 type:complete len:229 (-) Transcript_28001:61-747(-)